MGRAILSQIMLLEDLPILTLNSSRDGASTTPLENQFQCLTILRVKHFFLMPNLNLPFSSLKLLPLVQLLQTGLQKKVCLTRSCRISKSSQSLLFTSLNYPNSLSPSSYKMCLSSLTIFMALFWTSSKRSMSAFYWGYQHRTHYYGWGLTRVAKRERFTPLELLALLVFMQTRIQQASWAASVHCQHIFHFLSTNIPKAFSTELLNPLLCYAIYTEIRDCLITRTFYLALLKYHEVQVCPLLKPARPLWMVSFPSGTPTAPLILVTSANLPRGAQNPTTSLIKILTTLVPVRTPEGHH